GIASLVSSGLTYTVGLVGFLVGMDSCGHGSCDAGMAKAHAEFTTSAGITLALSILGLILGALAVSRGREPGARTVGILGIVGALFGLAGSFVLFVLSAWTSRKP